MEEVLSAQFAGIDAELARLRQRKQQIETEIARWIRAIAEGQASQSIMAAIGKHEEELRSITDKLLTPVLGLHPTLWE